MNKNLFRIIFNKRRGQLMAVAETSSSQGNGTRGEDITFNHPAISAVATVAISAIGFAVLCALGAVLWALPTPVAHAQVVAYRQAPGNQQPTVLQTANGVPQVNIQTPSAAGVSRNIYSQFDVESKGVILNNSHANVQTQQGGWVQANPWLATGSARVILNEVNASNPSQLNGYVEVAGQRAEVVIANPSGISVNGGGFINTSKATLTTGTPTLNGGSLEGYRVQAGTISINGKGLDLSTTDYAAILSRAVQVNAGIWANELKVLTGANQIDAASLAANTPPTSTAIAGTGVVPSFALDVAQIGGMYAGKIHLIGTEQGLGVRTAGTIGSTGGDLVLQNNGWLTSTGTLQASANLQITTQGNITNSGTLYANNDQTLSATGNVTNSGFIAAQGNTSITANSFTSSAKSVVAAGLKADGTLASSATSLGNLHINTTHDLIANGQNLAAGNIALTASSVDLSGSQTGAANIAISANAGSVNTSNATVATSGTTGVLAITAKTINDQKLDNTQGILSAGQLNLDVANLNNTKGQVIQTGKGDTTLTLASPTSTLNNTGGTLATNSANFEITAHTLDNTDGKVQHAGTGALAITADALTNLRGEIVSNQNASLQLASLDNTAGSVYASGNLGLAATGAITNTGFIAAQGNATLSANSLSSSAGSAASAVSVLGAGIKADGTFISSTSSSGGNLSITTTQALSANGQNLAAGNLTLSGSSVDLSGSKTGAANVDITATADDVNTTNATVATAGTLHITAKANANNAQTLNNTQGVFSAGQLKLEVANLNNSQGQITQTGTGDTTLTLTSPTGTLNNTNGTLATNSANLSITANTLTNTDGKLQHAGTGTLHITANTLNDQRGKIVSNNALVIDAGVVDHRAAKTAAKNITLTASSLNNNEGEIVQTGTGATTVTVTQGLDNTAGTLASNGKLTVTAKSLTNDQGQVSALGDLTVNLNTTRTAGASANAGKLSNLQGLVAANGDVTVTADSVDNTLGTIASVQKSLSITTTGATTNNSGKIQAALDITLTNAGLSNTRTSNALAISTTPYGSIIGRNIDINTNIEELNNIGGTIVASQAANLQTGALNNNAGLIQTGSDITIDTHGQTLTNTYAANYTSSNAALNGKGGIAAQGTSNFTTGNFNNDTGYIGSKGALIANSANISNTLGGQIQGLANLTLTAGNGTTTGTLNNTGGLIRSAATTTLNAGTVTNSNTLSTTNANLGIEGNDVAITTATLRNNSGAIRADNNLTITSAGTIDNSTGLMSAGDTLTLQDVQAQNSRSLAIANKDGTLIADKALTVTASSLGGDGKVLSKGDLNLALKANFTNSGQVIANGNATLTTTGNVSNSGKLQAGDTLTLTANNIDNAAAGEISALTTKINATRTLTNRGLIDGFDTQINANTVNNIGTGRIYGDHLSIAAVNLTNDTETLAGVTKAATIAARNRLDLGISDTLTNREHALIYSMGDIAIGGALDAATRRATGSATTLNNNSATIEAGLDLSISATTLKNTNEHFTYEERKTSEQNDVREDVTSNYYRIYTRTIYDPYIISTDPGKILSGVNMNLNAGSLTNQLSQVIAGKNLNVQGTSIQNTSVTSSHRVVDIGTNYNYQVVGQSCGWHSWSYGCDNVYGWAQSNYKPPSVNTAVTVIQANSSKNTSPDSTNTKISNLSNSSVAESVGNTGVSTARAGSVSLSQVSVAQAGATQVNAVSGASAFASTRKVDGTSEVKAAQPNTTLPTNSLYKTNPASNPNYVVEADSRFINNKTWLGSDYMTKSLSLDPTVTQKRLGDGFYEQKLIREQVAELTGRRFLADYTSDEQEYKALMDSGITFAKQYKLRPGIALTAQQIAQLTSDIVWLVEQTVTLPDGSSQKVLVPQVYVKVLPGDLDGSGTLLAGKDVNLNLSGDLTNSGTILGRNVVNLTAENVNNLGGRIGGTDVSVAARQDLNNIGGSISAINSLNATAGRDLNVQTTTRSASSNIGANSFSRTTIDRVAGLYVSGVDGTLVASAGRDLNIVAGVVSNAGSGTTSLSAANNFKISSVATSSSDLDMWDAQNYRKSSNVTDVGSTVQAGGNANLQAGQNLSATAANVQATGSLRVQAQDVHIEAGKTTADFDEAHKVSGGGFFGGATLVTRDTSNSSTAVASNFGGATVDIAASTKDINIKGSNVVSDNGTTLTAGSNVNIEAAQNTSSSSSYRQESKSGFSISNIGATPIGWSYSKTKQSDDNQNTSTTAAASTIGSIGGNVNIKAGNQYKQVGSDVLTPGGDINITAKKTDIVEARETNQHSSEQKFEQKTISAGLKGGIIDTVQATTQAVQAAKDSSSDRNRNLNALIAFGKGSDAYEQGKAMQSAYEKNGVIGGTDADGKPAPGAAAASGIKVSVSIGSSKSQSNSSTTSNTSAASTVKAGGSVNIKATGQGEGEGNLTIQGSNVSAAKDVSLSATKNVNVLASADTESNRSTNSSSSTSVGLSVGIGQGGAGLSLDIAASRGKGQANSDSTTYNNSHITGGNQVTITSGADTNVVGGNIKATQVTANVGGNLNVESLQDKAVSQASQKNTGIALSIPLVGTGGSASFSQSKQKSDSNYVSVNEQSGIKAGEGGFTINVGGNTDLKGAVIASSDKAVQDGKNKLTTNTLTTSDINNSMSASASSGGVSVGTNMMDGKYAMGKAIAGNLLNNGTANQSDASTTTSAISAAQVTVNGKTTDTSKEQLKDSNGKTVSTDTSNTNRTLAKADVAGLQKSAQDQQAGNMLVLNAAVAMTDPAFKAAFLDQAKMYKKVVDTKGEVSWQEMTPEEKAKIPPGSRVANNGIFNGGPNDPKPAQDLAQQNSSGGADYLVHFPKASNTVSELLVAGYQKFLENGRTGLTNATQQNVDLWKQTGGNITLDGHSRGGMTVGNALDAVKDQGGKGGATNVNLYGSAYNAQDAANTVNQITKGAGQVTSQVHKDDLVGTVLGGNAATGGTTPSGSSTLQEWINILGGSSTSHNNYGDGKTKGSIDDYWGGAKPVPQTVKPTNQLISLPAGESK